jgi:hypothetical protein
MTTTGKNRIMIYGPKTDGTYVVEFRTAEGEVLATPIRIGWSRTNPNRPTLSSTLDPNTDPLSADCLRCDAATAMRASPSCRCDS